MNDIYSQKEKGQREAGEGDKGKVERGKGREKGAWGTGETCSHGSRMDSHDRNQHLSFRDEFGILPVFGVGIVDDPLYHICWFGSFRPSFLRGCSALSHDGLDESA